MLEISSFVGPPDTDPVASSVGFQMITSLSVPASHPVPELGGRDDISRSITESVAVSAKLVQDKVFKSTFNLFLCNQKIYTIMTDDLPK